MLRSVMSGVVVLGLAACAEPEPKGNQGFALLQAQDYPAAEVYFTEKLARDPQNPYHLLNLGVALEQQGKLPEAVAQFRNAVTWGQNAPIGDVVTGGGAEQKTTTVAALAAHNLAKLGQ